MILSRPYRSEEDLHLILAWLSQQAPHTYMHPGDLVWWLRQNMLVDPEEALELFFEGDTLRGFVYCHANWSVIQGAPDLSAAAWDTLVACAVGKAAGKLTVQPHEWDAAQVAALGRAGFALTDNHMLRLVREMQETDLLFVNLPAGFHFADMESGLVSAEARVGLHQEVWQSGKVTLEAYQRLQSSPLYCPGLDVMVVSDLGEPAAYATSWYDPGSCTGQVEPVGTRSAFRRRGLGKALIREMSRRMAALGAKKVTIGTYEKNVAAAALYQSAGYTLSGRWIDFVRD